MFIGDVDARLNELESSVIFPNNSSFDLVEKMVPDIATVRVILQSPAVLFKCAKNNNNIKYFKNKRCADFILFEQSCAAPFTWRLHVFEFKRSVTLSSDSWPDRIISQFQGAYLNALCLAGYLNIQISDFALYTCYKNDKITEQTSDPSALRLAAHEPNGALAINIALWEKDSITLETSFNKLQCIHKRIQLNDDFYKEFAI